MQHLVLPFLVALTAVCAQGAQTRTPAPRASDSRNREIYVSVVDGDGKTVAGLTAADFTVREDNTPREVLSAGPATELLTISLLVDDSQAAANDIQFIRDGLTKFVERLSGKAEIAIATFGERPTSVINFTTSTAALKQVAGRMFQKTGSGAYLLDALFDASKGFQKRQDKRPTIVVVTTEGVEFSNRSYQQVLEAIQAGGAAVHVLSLGQPSDSRTDEMRNRNITIAEATSRTGGRRDQVLAPSGLAERLTQLADELTSQYVVQYARPEQLIPPEKVQVSVTRPGLTARAKTRAAEK